MNCINMKQLVKSALSQIENRIHACKAAQYKSDNRPMGWSETRYASYWNMEMFKAVYQYEKIAERFGVVSK